MERRKWDHLDHLDGPRRQEGMLKPPSPLFALSSFQLLTATLEIFGAQSEHFAVYHSGKLMFLPIKSI